jgi:hypothetical protein
MGSNNKGSITGATLAVGDYVPVNGATADHANRQTATAADV